MATDFELQVARRVKASVQRRLSGLLVEIRFFGSRARGDAREDSDLDLLVLTRDDGADVREGVHRACADTMLEMGYPLHVAPHVMTEERFAELVARERRFALDVMREGIAL